MQVLDCEVALLLTFWGISILFSTVAAPVCITTNSMWRQFFFLHILTNICCFLSEIDYSFFFFSKTLFIYSWERQRERQRHRQREKQAPCRKLDKGLDPRSPGSHPGLKAALNRWATRAAPQRNVFANRLPDKMHMKVNFRILISLYFFCPWKDW